MTVVVTGLVVVSVGLLDELGEIVVIVDVTGGGAWWVLVETTDVLAEVAGDAGCLVLAAVVDDAEVGGG